MFVNGKLIAQGEVVVTNEKFGAKITKIIPPEERGKNGKGTETDRDGFGYEGEWENGYMWNGKGYDKDGNIQYKWVNGIRIKQ